MTAAARPSFHHGDLRRTALALAWDHLEAGGVEALSLRTVAQAAGVTHRALYRHFADKRALLVALAAHGFGRLADAVEQALSAAASGPHTRAAAFDAYVDFALAHPHPYRVMFGLTHAELWDDPATGPEVRRVIAATEGTFFAVGDPTAARVRRDRVIAAWSLMHGLIDLFLNGTLPARDEAAAKAYILDRLAETIG